MVLTLQNNTPQINTSASIAPNAMVCGEVKIGENVRIMYGAQIIAENSSITIGANCIILENAVIRGTAGYKVDIGQNCIIGPQTHIAGCTIMDNVFIATGASVFHGACILEGAEVRINGVVHLKTVLDKNAIVPIGWIAVGNPARILSPDKHEEIWQLQKSLKFNHSVYGIASDEPAKTQLSKICSIMSERLKSILNDKES